MQSKRSKNRHLTNTKCKQQTNSLPEADNTWENLGHCNRPAHAYPNFVHSNPFAPLGDQDHSDHPLIIDLSGSASTQFATIDNPSHRPLVSLSPLAHHHNNATQPLALSQFPFRSTTLLNKARNTHLHTMASHPQPKGDHKQPIKPTHKTTHKSTIPKNSERRGC